MDRDTYEIRVYLVGDLIVSRLISDLLYQGQFCFPRLLFMTLEIAKDTSLLIYINFLVN